MKSDLSNVAYIDDDSDILSIAEIGLATAGKLKAVLIHGPQLAIDQLVRAAPDLILLDVMMPGTDGPTLLLEIQRHPLLAHIPVIFMTARVQPVEIARYMALGAIGVISKPFDVLTLADDIRRLWSQWCARAGAEPH